MRYLAAFCLVGLAAGCASNTMRTIELPFTPPLHSLSELSGRYSNRGLCHTSNDYQAVDAYLDVTLGVAKFPSRQGGSLAIRADDGSITVLRLDESHVVRETKFMRGSDFEMTERGVEFVQMSEGAGGEGNLSMKVAARLIISLRSDGTLMIKVHEDIRGVGGILVPLPYRDTRDLWYEFKKEANQSLEPTPTAGTSAAEQPLVPAAVVAHL